MKRFFISLIVCIFTVIASASVEFGGINYNINTSNNTATVIKSNVTGELIIPENINVDGIDYEVTEIDKCAFAECSITSVHLSKTIKTIGAWAFANGNEINFYISDLSSWCSITHGYARSVYGGTYQYEPIADYRLFLNEVEVTDLVIPDDITYVRKNAFSGCKSISKLSVHDSVTSIDDYAFYKCPNLKKIEFGKNVGTIGEYCFCKCSSIEELTLPQFLQTLKMGALQSLDKLTELTIPASVKTINSGCFLNDTSLTSVIFEDSGNDIIIGSNLISEKPIFSDCPLQKVYIGRDLKSKTISSNTGYYVPPFQNQTGLTSVRIGEGVRSLGSYLFYGCSSLTDINTPISLVEIGDGIFEGCTSLPIIDNIRYADKCAISVIDRDVDKLVLSPDTRLISHYCFSDLKKIKTVTLPSDLVFLGVGVFFGCSSLSKISIPENVIGISEKMFSKCENLIEIIIPLNVGFIGGDAFKGCKSLKEIVIPENVGAISDNAFDGCKSLTKIKFEDSENSIALGTNSSGTSRKSLFKDCPLEEVYIGRDIGMFYASHGAYDHLPFYKKETIKKLTIGPEVTRIRNYSFYGCTAIENIYALREQPISLESETFSKSIYSTCTLNVLPNSISKYSTVNIWRNFKKKVAIDPKSLGNENAGDVNGDKFINVLDIVEMVNYIKGKPSERFIEKAADLNGDGVVSTDDIEKISSIIMKAK